MPSLCLNVLFDAYPNVESAQAALFSYLDRAPNDAIHVTAGARAEQGFTFAKSVKARYPAMNVIFRKTPNDEQHKRMTPGAWFHSFAPWSDDGNLILAMMNESGVNDLREQNYWLMSAIDLAGYVGIRVVAPDVQTHNRFDPAAFEGTLRMLAKYDGWFTTHYYFDLYNGVPVDPILETVQAYCKTKGIAVKHWGITELGYAEALDPYHGYQGRIDGAVYGGQLADIARTYPDVKFFIYGWGRQTPWGAFDISGDQALQDKIVAFNQETPPVNQPYIPPPLNAVRGTLAKLPGSYVNVREQPYVDANDKGDLRKGEALLYGFSEQAPGWAYIMRRDVPLAGWVSLQNGAVEFTQETTPPPTPDTVTLPRADYDAAISALEDALALLRGGLQPEIPF